MMHLKEKTQLIYAVLRQSDQVGKVFACLVFKVNMKTNVFSAGWCKYMTFQSFELKMVMLRQHSH